MNCIALQSSMRAMRRATTFILLLCTPLYAEDLYGFDAAERLAMSTFQCVQDNVNFGFFVASLINASTGSVDSVGIDNILRAREAGFTNIQAYVTPCASSNCPSAHQQVANAFGTLRQRKITLSQVWIDVAGTEWSCDVTPNRKFIWALVRSIAAYGLPVGIRTNTVRWLTIVGEWSDLSAYYPLWYARLDDRENWPCKDFVAFGGWQKFDVCQYTYGNYPGCGVRHAVGFDYWPGRVGFAYIHVNARYNVDDVDHGATNDNYNKHLYWHQHINNHPYDDACHHETDHDNNEDNHAHYYHCDDDDI
ncbi:lysozyme 1 [Aphelenchoides avenae]|nr:lysozyme 1 [Aphelenchus avenae]